MYLLHRTKARRIVLLILPDMFLLADFQSSPLWLVIKGTFIITDSVLPLSQNLKQFPFRGFKCLIHAGSGLYVALFLQPTGVGVVCVLFVSSGASEK